MHLLLIRHGQSISNTERRLQGQFDSPLTDLGRAQARALAQRMLADGHCLSAVLSSDLSRAAETAEIVAARLDVPLSLDARLREYDIGILTNIVWTEIESLYPELWESPNHHQKWTPIPGEEGSETVRARLLALLADIEADTPYDHFLLRLHEVSLISIVDATDPARSPVILDAPGCDATFPFETAGASIYLPAGTPELNVEAVPTRIGVPGQENITVFAGEMTYETSSPQGDLVLLNLTGEVMKRSASGDAPFAAADIFSAVHLLSGGEVVATDSVLSGTGIVLTPGAEYVVARGTEHDLIIACDVCGEAEVGNYVIEFADPEFIAMADRNLETAAHPDVPGTSFPLRSAEISIASENLATSFTNYPNPFNPARGEETTIGFYITESARVDIEIFTITGELVRKVASNSERSDGAHQEDKWTGLNADGLGVLPGTYLCRITATYASGRVESCKRKVMVIR